MGRLPETIEGDASFVGVRPSTNAVQPTDYGLGDAAKAAGAYAQQRQQRIDTEDARTAQQILQTAKTQFEPQFQERAASYDGRAPGFARQNLAAFDDHFTPVVLDPSLKPGVRDAMQRQLDQMKAQFGDRAIGVESEKRAGVVDAQVKVKRQTLVGQSLIGFNEAYGARYQKRIDAYDGSQPGLHKDVLADFDEEAANAVAQAPPQFKEDVQSALAAKRVEVAANAMTVEDQGHDAFVVTQAKSGVAQIANNVLSNPAAFDTAQPDLDRMAAGVPGKLRAKFIEEAKGELASARVEGLIDRRDLETAKAELASGRYDAVMKTEKKQSLLLHIEQQERSGPRTEEEWRQRYEAEDNLKGATDAIVSGQSTGNLQAIVQAFKSPRDRAEAQNKIDEARQVSIATGNLRGQSEAELRSRATASPPDPSSADYGRAFRAWELSRKAASSELETRRKDPAAWAMNSATPGDTGAALQERWKAYTGAQDPQGQGQAGRQYVALSIGLQDKAGVPLASMRVLPKDVASELAASFAKAPPEQKAPALRSLAAMVQALPTNVTLPSGVTVSARQMAARELRASGLGPADVSAITDLAENPGKLSLYADAVANPNALKVLPGKGEELTLNQQITQRLSNFVATANADPGSPDENAGRVSRVRVMARHLMLTQGLAPVDAVKAAAADLSDGYHFVDGWRMPASLAAAPADLPGLHIGDGQKWQAVRMGAAYAMHDLVSNDGAMLAPAAGNPALTPQQAQAQSADIVQHRGRWVTMGNDQGLQLMVPDPRGWTPMADKYGRPIRLTWDQLSGLAHPISVPRHAGSLLPPEQSQTKPGAWLPPPPNAALPASVAPAQAQKAFTAAIETQESHGVSGLTSGKGAMGLRQMRPEAAQDAATRLGVAYDPARLLNDPGYNRQLSDNHIAWLSKRYDGNVALIAAAYDAGPGKVDSWLRSIGDPRRGMSADDWVAHLPFGETRRYVRQVLPRALSNLGGRLK